MGGSRVTKEEATAARLGKERPGLGLGGGAGSRNGEKTPIRDWYEKPSKQGGLRVCFLFLSFSALPQLRNPSLCQNSLSPPPRLSAPLQRLGEGMGASCVVKPGVLARRLIFLCCLSSPTAAPKSSFDPHHRSQPSYERPSYLPPGPGLMLRQKSIGMSSEAWV